jgi:hypothetical protein
MRLTEIVEGRVTLHCRVFPHMLSIELNLSYRAGDVLGLKVRPLFVSQNFRSQPSAFIFLFDTRVRCFTADAGHWPLPLKPPAWRECCIRTRSGTAWPGEPPTTVHTVAPNPSSGATSTQLVHCPGRRSRRSDLMEARPTVDHTMTVHKAFSDILGLSLVALAIGDHCFFKISALASKCRSWFCDTHWSL